MDFAPGHGTLWPYLPGGQETHQRLFNCPANSPPPYNFGGDVDPNLVYTFNPDLVSWHGSSGSPDFGVNLVRVRHTDHKILLYELRMGGMITGDPDAISEDPQHPGYTIIVPQLAPWHFGMANCAFADGHVEPLDPAVFNGTHLGYQGTGLYVGGPTEDH